MTNALSLVAEASEGGTLRLSCQRLMAVLFGSSDAHVLVLLTQDRIAVGICICLFVGLMDYLNLKTDPCREYFASVCGQSASVIAFLSKQQGQMDPSNDAVLARTILTFVGIFFHALILNLSTLVTARALFEGEGSLPDVCHRHDFDLCLSLSLIVTNVSKVLKASIDDFCRCSTRP
jgi:hypothetical protein